MSVHLSVCLSVCLSRSDIVLKGTKISSLTESPKNLVFFAILCYSKGATPNFPCSRGIDGCPCNHRRRIRGAPHVPLPNKILENIVYFSGNYHVKFRHFRAKRPIMWNSEIVLIVRVNVIKIRAFWYFFRANITYSSSILLFFFIRNFRAKMSCLPKLTELLRLCVELVSKISNLCNHNPLTSQTDRRTNGRHVMARPCFRYAL